MQITHSKAPFGESYPVYVPVETLWVASMTATGAHWNSGLYGRIGRLLANSCRNSSLTRLSISACRCTGWTAAFKARAALIERFPQQTHLVFLGISATAICICFQVRIRTRTMHRVDALIDAALEEVHGCNSAEHGIGVIKPPFLHDSRPEPELDAMRRFNAMH